MISFVILRAYQFTDFAEPIAIQALATVRILRRVIPKGLPLLKGFHLDDI